MNKIILSLLIVSTVLVSSCSLFNKKKTAQAAPAPATTQIVNNIDDVAPNKVSKKKPVKKKAAKNTKALKATNKSKKL